MKLLQFLLWALIIYFAIRVIRSLVIIRKRSHRHQEEEKPYVNIEDADFEDITGKNENDKKEDKSRES